MYKSSISEIINVVVDHRVSYVLWKVRKVREERGRVLVDIEKKDLEWLKGIGPVDRQNKVVNVRIR